jgi:hypothetical protein
VWAGKVYDADRNRYHQMDKQDKNEQSGLLVNRCAEWTDVAQDLDT